MLDRCPSDKCFLSHYPPAVGDPGYQVPVLCKSHFDVGAQMPSFEARNFNIDVGDLLLSLPSHATSEMSQSLLWSPDSVSRCRNPLPAEHHLGKDVGLPYTS